MRVNGISGSDDLSDAGGARPSVDEDFLVVGLGASAGGISALKDFFAQVPKESRMTYVVILHLFCVMQWPLVDDDILRRLEAASSA